LGRAVIGGLFLATVSTLVFVPVVFAWVKENMIRRGYRFDAASAHADPI